jgi:general secretion pathway protein G
VDVGRFPTNEEGLNALSAQPAGLKNWRGPYLKRLPEDPWGHPYLYRFPGRHNKNGYDIASAGPDGKPGGGDDLGNWDNR